jgi:hypothetical protein
MVVQSTHSFAMRQHSAQHSAEAHGIAGKRAQRSRQVGRPKQSTHRRAPSKWLASGRWDESKHEHRLAGCMESRRRPANHSARRVQTTRLANPRAASAQSFACPSTSSLLSTTSAIHRLRIAGLVPRSSLPPWSRAFHARPCALLNAILRHRVGFRLAGSQQCTPAGPSRWFAACAGHARHPLQRPQSYGSRCSPAVESE